LRCSVLVQVINQVPSLNANVFNPFSCRFCCANNICVPKAETRDASSSLSPNVGVNAERLDDFKINELSNGSSGEINDEENVNPLRDVHTEAGIINAIRLANGLTDLGTGTVPWPIAIKHPEAIQLSLRDGQSPDFIIIT
jgi:hypothetical protein